MTRGEPQARILVVCAANVCRSPAAHLLLAAALSGQVMVDSAGLDAVPREPIDPVMADLLGADGIDAGDFRSRCVCEQDLLVSDLVLAMTRIQRAQLAQLVPSAVRRCFTMREFARIAARPEFTALPPERIDRVRAAVSKVGMLRSVVPRVPVADDDIPDPSGGPIGQYTVAYSLIAGASATIARTLRVTS